MAVCKNYNRCLLLLSVLLFELICYFHLTSVVPYQCLYLCAE